MVGIAPVHIRLWPGRDGQYRRRERALSHARRMDALGRRGRADWSRVELRGLRDAGLARSLSVQDGRPSASLGLALTGLAALTLVRLGVAAWAPLAPDEAYYWVWSRSLAPGFLDAPPMVALWI